MKQSCEKPKTVTETIDIGMLIKGSTLLTAEKEGGSVKDSYEKPTMVTETTDIGILAAGIINGSVSPIPQAEPMNDLCPPCPEV